MGKQLELVVHTTRKRKRSKAKNRAPRDIEEGLQRLHHVLDALRIQPGHWFGVTDLVGNGNDISLDTSLLHLGYGRNTVPSKKDRYLLAKSTKVGANRRFGTSVGRRLSSAFGNSHVIESKSYYLHKGMSDADKASRDARKAAGKPGGYSVQYKLSVKPVALKPDSDQATTVVEPESAVAIRRTDDLLTSMWEVVDNFTAELRAENATLRAENAKLLAMVDGIRGFIK